LRFTAKLRKQNAERFVPAPPLCGGKEAGPFRPPQRPETNAMLKALEANNRLETVIFVHEFLYLFTCGCSKMSNFGTATLNLDEKAGFRPLFRKPVSKLTEFWNRLTFLLKW
jgi:hypothetical protein